MIFGECPMSEEFFADTFDFDGDTILRAAEKAMEQSAYSRMLAEENGSRRTVVESLDNMGINVTDMSEFELSRILEDFGV